MSGTGLVTASAETLAALNAALSKGFGAYFDDNGGLNKATVSLATGLTAYDLQAPAKNLYPVITPLRNSIPRVTRPNPGDAARWKAINSITGSGFDAMGWVPEGQRSAAMSYASTPYTAPYVTLGEESSVTFEAEAAAEGFEDVNATNTLRTLQKTMLKEENAIIGGNASLALGTPATPTASASGSGATLPSATYSVIVVALTYEGLMGSSLSGGIPTSKTITGQDGNTYVLNGGSSNKSANVTQAVTLGQTLFATLGTIPAGAVGFAWFVGTAGSETLQAITTINSVAISAPLASNRQTATAITADCSRNQSLAFDGILNIGLNTNNNSYVYSMPTGTAGTGTFLTASGRGSIIEIDNMLQAMWDNYRISPTVIYVNSQEERNITTKCLTNASGPLLRYQADASGNYAGMHASGSVRWYYNPFSVEGGTDIPIKVHPTLPKGTILAYAERLPAWYQNNEVENPLALMIRRDYYRVDWPIVTRRRDYGVYAEETMAAYFPAAVGLITNIGNG